MAATRFALSVRQGPPRPASTGGWVAPAPHPCAHPAADERARGRRDRRRQLPRRDRRHRPLPRARASSSATSGSIHARAPVRARPCEPRPPSQSKAPSARATRSSRRAGRRSASPVRCTPSTSASARAAGTPSGLYAPAGPQRRCRARCGLSGRNVRLSSSWTDDGLRLRTTTARRFRVGRQTKERTWAQCKQTSRSRSTASSRGRTPTSIRVSARGGRPLHVWVNDEAGHKLLDDTFAAAGAVITSRTVFDVTGWMGRRWALQEAGLRADPPTTRCDRQAPDDLHLRY